MMRNGVFEFHSGHAGANLSFFLHYLLIFAVFVVCCFFFLYACMHASFVFVLFSSVFASNVKEEGWNEHRVKLTFRLGYSPGKARLSIMTITGEKKERIKQTNEATK